MYLEDNKIRIKVCGLTRLEDARYASGALADFLGFIFYPGSPRYISPENAAEIIGWTEGPECVGVFVDQPIEEVAQIVESTGIHVVQLHGDESPEFCAQIDKVKVIKAFRVSSEMTTDHLRYLMDPYTKHVDYFLFDTRVEGQHGGTGKTFDWEILGDLSEEYDLFLSGGLNPGNVGKAIQTVHPFAVDLSSGLESSPGVKDVGLMEDFFEEMEKINESFTHF